MPSSVAHGLTALALGAAMLPQPVPRRVAYTGVACAVLLDLDAIGRPFGHGDLAWLGGHRGLTHSILFAAVVGAMGAVVLRRVAPDAGSWQQLCAFLFAAMVSHGILDALTDVVQGIAFLAPFSWQRFRAPWELFDGLWDEVFIVWLPAYLILRYAQHRRQGLRPLG